MACCTADPIVRPDGSMEKPPISEPLDSTWHPSHFVNQQGMWLRWLQWAPPVNVQTTAVLFLSHGVCEHAGRYDYIALAFARLGVHVFAHDHQGHGGSEGFQKRRAFFNCFEDLVDDLILFVRNRSQVDAKLAALPRFVLGHSMGSLVALRAVQREPDLFTGCILSGATLSPAPELATPFKRFLARTFSKISPTLGVGDIEDKFVSLNEEYLSAVRRDPLMVREKLTARWGHEMLEANDRGRRDLRKITLPLLMLHGGDDHITSIDGSRIIMREAMKCPRSMYTFPGKYHDIFSHTDVFADAVTLCTDFIHAYSGGHAGAPAGSDVKERFADDLCPPQLVVNEGV